VCVVFGTAAELWGKPGRHSGKEGHGKSGREIQKKKKTGKFGGGKAADDAASTPASE